MTSAYALGVDFGTKSARSVLVDIRTGVIRASQIEVYTSGVIDECLPGTLEDLPLGWSLQDPSDWLHALTTTIRLVLSTARVNPSEIVGLGLDFTACTILPTSKRGAPLCSLDGMRSRPHAWPKLWKHHASEEQARRITTLARERKETWLANYGGTISAEWVMPKALQLLEEDPATYEAADLIVEGADWIVWQLTGRLVRNACAAGYKATWNKHTGYPAPEFTRSLHPSFSDLFPEKLSGEVELPGRLAGTLQAGWASRLGLPAGLPIAVPIIDAHAAAIGGGATAPSTLFLILGTSNCHLLSSESEVPVPGISGVVEDGIVPGLFGYEAGQASVGDMFEWFASQCTPPEYHEDARRRGCSVHDVLSQRANALRPGENGLLALDWWNGCRTPLVDGDLRGAVLGYSVASRPEDVYRGLIEASAYGTHLILDLFQSAGLTVQRLRAGGGLTKNDLLMSIYADVLGLPIEISATEHTSAIGAAVLGAVAGGAFGSTLEAAAVMTQKPARVELPNQDHMETYAALYGQYKRLVEALGEDANSPLRALREIRRLATRSDRGTRNDNGRHSRILD